MTFIYFNYFIHVVFHINILLYSIIMVLMFSLFLENNTFLNNIFICI